MADLALTINMPGDGRCRAVASLRGRRRQQGSRRDNIAPPRGADGGDGPNLCVVGNSFEGWQIEIALERSCLHLAQNEKDKGREKLEEAKRLVKKTEASFVPHVQTWAEWKRPSYVDTFKEGDIVGYHRCDADVAALERALT